MVDIVIDYNDAITIKWVEHNEENKKKPVDVNFNENNHIISTEIFSC